MRIIRAEEYALQRDTQQSYEKEREIVQDILARVRQFGDQQLRSFTRRFDGVDLTDFRIPEEQYEQAYKQVSQEFLTALRKAMQNIRIFHEKQKRESWQYAQPDGTILGQVIRPLRRVGVYVPGGRAAYPSSVLMNVIPAQVAGVKEIVLISPPTSEGTLKDPGVLVAIRELGISEVYRIGGAQGIAALAYGTESIRPVDKIVGPGNLYVALAKQAVFGQVAIDMIAGPTEILVIADDSADPDYIAADLLSQAEHDPLAASILVTTSECLAKAVQASVEQQLADLPRKEIAAASIETYGAIVLVDSLDEAIAMSNRIAPEHLELQIEDAPSYVPLIENAGAIFVGPYSSEPVGDYFAGPNHVLPTNGTARFSSPLNVDDFMKKSSLIQYSKEALLRDGQYIVTLAEAEGLHGHARAVGIRMKKEGVEGKL
ncbi:histidinol dehydrogenase [Fodinisporobacter ferrooxydans]|uniref:Histidinol dehydrogenase n=1 Tax=Fodinisporobacter ferrooxydans TaxID=2901836 RepID=A0ABY4CU54_9BACL|nr:histidinol dehydrogenase [Alicyclobacillaceae bacterium MYW30-H2]